MFSAFRHYLRWQVAGELFLFSMLLAISTACLGILIYSRSRLTRFQAEKPSEASEAQEALKFLSFDVVRMTGVVLVVIFFVIGSR